MLMFTNFLIVNNNFVLSLLKTPLVYHGSVREPCNSEASLDFLRSNVREKVDRLFYCGPGIWRPLFYLNMSDLSQSCPTGWNSVTTPL